jgi:endonuclease/exonuclease/phosphatase family metal-dependent hydrolase
VTTLPPPATGQVRWTLVSEPADRMVLDRWCLGVGPPVLTSVPGPESSVVNSLVVVTWNVHVGGGNVPGLVDDLRAGRLTHGQPVEHFVLLLQEAHRGGLDVPGGARVAVPRRITGVPRDAPRMDIVETAARLGLELFYVPSMANGNGYEPGQAEDRGNAILSTLPLTGAAAIELPYEAQRRVAAVATVNGMTASGVPWHLRVVSVHLDHRSRGLLQSLGSGRVRQARALVSALGSEGPVAVGGDLNTWSLGFLEDAAEVLEEHFPLPVHRPQEPTFATRSGLGGIRLDHLMFRLPPEHEVGTRRLADVRGSDHHPLLGLVRFPDQHPAVALQEVADDSRD